VYYGKKSRIRTASLDNQTEYDWYFNPNGTLTLPLTNKITAAETPKIGFLITGIEPYNYDRGADQLGHTYQWESATQFNLFWGEYFNDTHRIIGSSFYPIGHPESAVTVIQIASQGNNSVTFSGPIGAGPYEAHSADYAPAHGNPVVIENGGGGTWTFGSDRKLTTPGDILPEIDNLHNLGSPDRQWHHLYVSTGSIYLGNIKLSNEGGNLAVYNVNNAGAQNETQTIVKVVNSSPTENFVQDGGTASAVYDNLISFIECGGSARRGASETYDGGNSSTTNNTVIINGGGA